MNLHKPQGLGAEAEMQTLMTVAQNLISSRNSAPCFGQKQDTATGMYILTSRDTFLERAQVCNILVFAVREHGLRLPQPAVRVRRADGSWRELWTGLQLASFALPGRLAGADEPAALVQYRQPADFRLHPTRLDYPSGGVENDSRLPFLVVDSEILFGRIDKVVAGASHRSLLHAIAVRTGVPVDRALNEACDFVDRCSWLASAYLTQRGFSVGLEDCMFANHQARAEREIRRTARSAHARVGELLSGNTAESRALLYDDHHADRVGEIEKRVGAIVGDVFNKTAKLVSRCIGPSNAFNLMLRSGGKGKVLNMGQIMGCLGQQRLAGQRVVNTHISVESGVVKSAGGSHAEGGRENTTGGARGARRKRDIAPGGLAGISSEPSTRVLDHSMYRYLPHVQRGMHPDADQGGFIDRCFIEGLTPRQFFYHAQGGREGLVDTAIKTAQTGYLQRKAMKSCEALAVRYDGTVRDATNQIVSVRYGDNGCDPRWLVRKQLRFIGMSRAALERAVFYDERRDVEWRAAGGEQRATLERERAALIDALRFLRREATRADTDCEIATPNDLETIVRDVTRETQRTADAELRGRAFAGRQWRTEDDADVRWLETDARRARLLREQRIEAAPQLEPLAGAADAAQRVERYVTRWRHELRIADHLTECEVRLRLCSKQVLRRYELSATELERVLDIYQDVLFRAQIEPGESVGAEMVMAIGQPATQMTLVSSRAPTHARARSHAHQLTRARARSHAHPLTRACAQNTFHIAGSVGAAVAGGTQRMVEISEATRPEKMKGIKVMVPLHDKLFGLRAQRVLGEQLLGTLLSRETRRELALGAGVRGRLALRRAFAEHAQSGARDAMRAARKSAMRAVALASVAGTADAEFERQQTAARGATAALFAAIDGVFGARGDIVTLASVTHDWRRVDAARLRTRSIAEPASRGWSAEARAFLGECDGVLVADVAGEWRNRPADAERFCETLWRAALPVFGADVAFVVLPRASTAHLLSVAFAARGARPEYIDKLYDTLRVERAHVPLEFGSGATRLPAFSRAVLRDARHARPESVARSVRSTAGADDDVEAAIDDAVGAYKAVERGNAHARHLYKNIVATSVRDLVSSVAICYEPLVDDGAGNWRVRFDESGGAQRANDSERLLCEMHYADGCFDGDDAIGCRRPECVLDRDDPSAPRHATVCAGCLGNWVLVLRVDPGWFVRNDVLPAVLERSLARKLGPSYQVLVGDLNSEAYIPIRVRVFTCCVADECAALDVSELRALDNFAPPVAAGGGGARGGPGDEDGEAPLLDARGVSVVPHNPAASDAENAELARRAAQWSARKVRDMQLAVLDRVKWRALHHRFCGPASGSIVMCERKRTAVYTEESGIEHVHRNVIVSDSSDLYHLLGLRGVDTWAVRSNSLHDMARVFGVEACRAALIDEYDEMMASGGSFVNRVHYALRADMQTRNGRLQPLTHAGVIAAPHDPIQSASHCRTGAMFFGAGVNRRGALPLASPSACVALGQPLTHQGTGACDLRVDPSVLSDPERYVFVPPEPRTMLEMLVDRQTAEFEHELDTICAQGWSNDGDEGLSDGLAGLDLAFVDTELEEGEVCEFDYGDEGPLPQFSPAPSDDDESEPEDDPLHDMNDGTEQLPSAEMLDALNALNERPQSIRERIQERVKRARQASAADGVEQYDPVAESRRVEWRKQLDGIVRSAQEYDPERSGVGALDAVRGASPSALRQLADAVRAPPAEPVEEDDDEEDFNMSFMAGSQAAFGGGLF